MNQGNGVINEVTVGSDTVSEHWSATAVHSASTPVADPGNAGNGTMGAVVLGGSYTVSENWTVTCNDATVPGSEVFSVVGSVSGAQADATVGVPYTSDSGEVSFTISAGGIPFVVGDFFTFSANYDVSTPVFIVAIQGLLILRMSEEQVRSTAFLSLPGNRENDFSKQQDISCFQRVG